MLRGRSTITAGRSASNVPLICVGFVAGVFAERLWDRTANEQNAQDFRSLACASVEVRRAAAGRGDGGLML